MNRLEQLAKLQHTQNWDIIIIGGGASGLGTAVDAASRGYKTVLFEAIDFAKGTSSRSTKLVHGGVRYLEQGNVSLVKEALKERGLMAKNATHLVKNMTFVIPNYNWWRGYFYTIGLTIYDVLAGGLSLGKSKYISNGWLSIVPLSAMLPGLNFPMSTSKLPFCVVPNRFSLLKILPV